MFARFLKTAFVFSFLFSLSLNAYQMGSYFIANNIGTFPGSLNTPHQNEDEIFVCENLDGSKIYDLCFGVLDGHSGKDVASFVKESIPLKLDQFFKAESDFCEEKFKELFQDLEQGIESKSSLAGSTAVMACVRDDDLWLINLGDSRAIFCQNGEAFKTKDHKPDFGTDEFKRIISEGGSVIIEYEFIYGLFCDRFVLNRIITPSLDSEFE